MDLLAEDLHSILGLSKGSIRVALPLFEQGQPLVMVFETIQKPAGKLVFAK